MFFFKMTDNKLLHKCLEGFTCTMVVILFFNDNINMSIRHYFYGFTYVYSTAYHKALTSFQFINFRLQFTRVPRKYIITVKISISSIELIFCWDTGLS